MNRFALAAAALIAIPVVACSEPAPEQSDGVQEYSVRVPADQAQQTADGLMANGAEINGQLCYPRRYCSIGEPDADGMVTVLASMLCPDY